MFGSIFYNLWAALFSFAAYFIWAIQNPFAMPLPTIGKSFVAAALGFVIMYAIRLFIGYVFYTPEAPAEAFIEENGVVRATDDSKQHFIPQNNLKTAEFGEENTEEIAQVVRTMLHGEQDKAFSR